jgi:allantoate deiminase
LVILWLQSGYDLVTLTGTDGPPLSPGYVEVHIEQGPVLEKKGVALGVVPTICGQTRLTVTVQGAQGHAGTVPMALRKDAMAAAAEVYVTIEKICGGGR